MLVRRGERDWEAGMSTRPDVDARFAPVVAALAKRPRVMLEPGWGKGNLVLKVDAKIFAILGANGVVAKLPRERVDELVDAGAGTRFDPRKNGHVMKEWLVAGAGSDPVALAREAYRFVSGSPARARARKARDEK
jgi:hypothetical protein